MIAIALFSACWVNQKEPSDNDALAEVLSSVNVYSVLPDNTGSDIEPDKYYSCVDLESSVIVNDGYLPALAYEWIDTSGGEEIVISNDPALTADDISNSHKLYLRVIPTVDGVAHPSMNSDVIEFEQPEMSLLGPTQNPTEQNSVSSGIHAELTFNDGIGEGVDYSGGLIYGICDERMWEFRLTWSSSDNVDFNHETNDDVLELYPCDECADGEIAQLTKGDAWEIRVEARIDGSPEWVYNNSIFSNYQDVPYTLNNSIVDASEIEYLQNNEIVTTIASSQNLLSCRPTIVDYDNDSLGTRYTFEYENDSGTWEVLQSGQSSNLVPDTNTGSWLPSEIGTEGKIRCLVRTSDAEGEYVFSGETIAVAN